MEDAHKLAVVSRAKAIARQADQPTRDELLGYLCVCADIDGSWWALLKPEAASNGDAPGATPLQSLVSLMGTTAGLLTQVNCAVLGSSWCFLGTGVSMSTQLKGHRNW